MKKFHVNFTYKEDDAIKSDSLTLGAKSARGVKTQINKIVELVEIEKIQEV